MKKVFLILIFFIFFGCSSDKYLIVQDIYTCNSFGYSNLYTVETKVIRTKDNMEIMKNYSNCDDIENTVNRKQYELKIAENFVKILEK